MSDLPVPAKNRFVTYDAKKRHREGTGMRMAKPVGFKVIECILNATVTSDLLSEASFVI